MKLLKNNDMSANKIVWLVFIMGMFSALFMVFYNQYYLKRKGVKLNCEIISIVSNYKSAPTFKCKILKQSSEIIFTSNSNVKKSEIFIGKYFPAIYFAENNIGQILITPENFKKFDMSFPDSLKWVLKYKY